MNTVVKTKFSVKPVVAALAVALSAASAYADPTPTQLPGAGLIRAVNPGTTITSPKTFYCVQTAGVGCVAGTGGAGDQIYNGSLSAAFFPGSIQLNNAGTVARAVIQWGGAQTGLPTGSALDTTIRESYNPAGFNIGANAKVFFTSSATVTNASVLNIDATGNPSQLFGQLVSTADVTLGTGVAVPGVGGGAAPVVFVSNANGIVVGPTGYMQIPSGGGLIGANLNNKTAILDFVADNGAGTTGYLNVISGQSRVEVQGAIDGGIGPFVSNVPAAFVLLVGGDVVNTGNIYANKVQVDAGMIANAGASDTIGGISKTAVQRLYNVDTSSFVAGPNEGTTVGTLTVGKSGSTFVNTGTISSKGGAITLWGAKGVRSGTAGSASLTVGLFADTDIVTNVYEAGGMTELYNVVGRFTNYTGQYIDNLSINQAAGWDGDVIIAANTRASQTSSIEANSAVDIRGVNVTINSTINQAQNAAINGDVTITSTNSVTITKNVGSADDLIISNSGAGGINISGNLSSDNDLGGVGGIYISNTGAGSPTTISGNVVSGNATTDLGEPVSIDVNGPLNITGSLVSTTGDVNVFNASKTAATVINNAAVFAYYDVNITTHANTDINSWIYAGTGGAGGSAYIYNDALSSATTTTIAGAVWAYDFVDIHNNAGTGSNLNVDAALVAGGDIHVFSNGSLRMASALADDRIDIDVNGLNMVLTGAQEAGSVIDIYSPNAQGKVYTSAILTAPEIDLEILNFKGVRDNGQDYTSVAQKPNAQLVTDTLYLTAWGSINSPLSAASNPLNDWLKNSMWIKPYTPGAQVYASLSAIGGGFQAINLGVRGDAAIDSGDTLTPFFLVGYVSPSVIPPFLGSNLGSSLIVQTEGNLDIFAGNIPGFSPQFLFPGGVAFKAGGYLSVNTNVNNAIASTQIYPFSGQWFESPTIIDTGYHATNPGSRINYSSYPLTGFGTAYWLTQPVPGLFQFVNTPDARFYNVYSTAIVGGAICNVPNPGPSPWPPAGC